jgi:uncharacterized protein YjbI with pentapeptide repeats
VSERFSKAVEQLGATNADVKRTPAIDVRTGGLFSLRRIALDSEENTPQAFLVIAAYIRNNYKPQTSPPKRAADGCAGFRLPRADIGNAFTFVLPDVVEKLLRDTGQETLRRGFRGTRLDQLGLDGMTLERLDLTQLKARNAHLVSSKFRGSILEVANFDGARLTGADFTDAHLRGSSFKRACLAKAKLRRADLRGANFTGALLDGADFRDARFSRTTKFKPARLEGAKFSKGATILALLSKAQRRVIAAPN